MYYNNGIFAGKKLVLGAGYWVLGAGCRVEHMLTTARLHDRTTAGHELQ